MIRLAFRHGFEKPRRAEIGSVFQIEECAWHFTSLASFAANRFIFCDIGIWLTASYLGDEQSRCEQSSSRLDRNPEIRWGVPGAIAGPNTSEVCAEKLIDDLDKTPIH